MIMMDILKPDPNGTKISWVGDDSCVECGSLLLLSKGRACSARRAAASCRGEKHQPAGAVHRWLILVPCWPAYALWPG